MPEPILNGEHRVGPDHQVLLADSVGLALLVVLETLSPPERLAFVLHDMFDLPFDEIADIVGSSPVPARQFAIRAQRRVPVSALGPDGDLSRPRADAYALPAVDLVLDFE